MSRFGNPYLRIVLLFAVIGIWEAAVRLFAVPVYILPRPSAIAYAFYNGVSSLVYVQNLWITLLETLLGFIVGTALAFVLGIAVALSRRTEYYSIPSSSCFSRCPKWHWRRSSSCGSAWASPRRW